MKDNSLLVPALQLLMADNEWFYLKLLPQPQPAQILPAYPQLHRPTRVPMLASFKQSGLLYLHPCQSTSYSLPDNVIQWHCPPQYLAWYPTLSWVLSGSHLTDVLRHVQLIPDCSGYYLPASYKPSTTYTVPWSHDGPCS